MYCNRFDSTKTIFETKNKHSGWSEFAMCYVLVECVLCLNFLPKNLLRRTWHPQANKLHKLPLEAVYLNFSISTFEWSSKFAWVTKLRQCHRSSGNVAILSQKFCDQLNKEGANIWNYFDWFWLWCNWILHGKVLLIRLKGSLEKK